MTPEDSITSARAGDVVTITIDRPAKKNALTKGMFAKLAALFDEAAHDTDVRVLVLTGSGDAFCSGADLTSTGDGAMTGFGPIDGAQWMREIGQAALALHKCPKPTIAAVNGVAAGAGCNLALGCDLVLAAESARFSQIFVRRGLNIDFGGTWLLPRLVGLQQAKLLAFTGDMTSARAALDLGLVAEVVPDAELPDRAAALAGQLAERPPVPLMLMKNGLNQSSAWTMDQALEYEAHAQAVCFGTDDLREAILSWAQKRDATYHGR